MDDFPTMKRCLWAGCLFASVSAVGNFLLASDVDAWQFLGVNWIPGKTPLPPLSTMLLPALIEGGASAIFLYGPALGLYAVLHHFIPRCPARCVFLMSVAGVVGAFFGLGYLLLGAGLAGTGPEEYQGRSLFLQQCGLDGEAIDAITPVLAVMLLIILPSLAAMCYLLQSKICRNDEVLMTKF